MASIHLQGTLVDTLGEIDVGAVLTWTHLTATGEVIPTTKVDLIIPPNGFYSIDVEYGQIRIDYRTRNTERFIAEVVVNQDSTATSIPELLNAAVPVTDPVILQMQDILSDTEAAKDLAEAAAVQLTTQDLIGSTAIYGPSQVVTTSGFLSNGDGGTGSWIQNGVTAQTANQTPAQLGDALLNDGNGNQWEFVGDTIHLSQVGNAVQAAINGVNISVITGDISKAIEVPAFTVPSSKELTGLNLKYSGSGGEDFITLDSNVTGANILNCKLDGNSLVNQIIRGNGGIDCYISNNEILNAAGIGIQITKGATNDNFNIEKNKIRSTVGHSIQLRGFFNSNICRNNLASWGSGKNAIELQDDHDNIYVCENTITSTGDLFGIESAGSAADITNSRICDNIMVGEFTGISGKFSDSSVCGNVFTGGQNSHRSGIEMIGVNLIINDNKINGGGIVVASNGANSPSINALNITINGNLIINYGISGAIKVGAVSTATGTPTSVDVDIKNNFIDMSQATGSALRCILVGDYGDQSEIDNVNINNNTLIGGSQASSEAIRLNPLPSSGTVNIKLNTFKNWNKGIRINNDNLSNAHIRFNDLSQNISTTLSDASTTTNVIFTENET